LNEPFSACFPEDAYVSLAAAFREGLGSALPAAGTPTMSLVPSGDWLDSAPALGNWFHPEIDESTAATAGRTSLPRGPRQRRLPRLWMLTPHFYDPRAGAPDRNAEPERYGAAVAAADRLILEWNVAPLVGEFGSPSEEPRRDDCHRIWIDEFERRGWSWCHW